MSRLNRNRSAFKHGVYAEHTILPGESVEEFDALHRYIAAELKPDGPLEEDHVRSIAQLLWRKRRLNGLRLAPQMLSYTYIMNPVNPGWRIRTDAPGDEAPALGYNPWPDERSAPADAQAPQQASPALPTIEAVMEQFELAAKLDAMIDRHMRALGRTKIFKQEFIRPQPKTIDVTPPKELPQPAQCVAA